MSIACHVRWLDVTSSAPWVQWVGLAFRLVKNALSLRATTFPVCSSRPSMQSSLLLGMRTIIVLAPPASEPALAHDFKATSRLAAPSGLPLRLPLWPSHIHGGPKTGTLLVSETEFPLLLDALYLPFLFTHVSLSPNDVVFRLPVNSSFVLCE